MIAFNWILLLGERPFLEAGSVINKLSHKVKTYKTFIRVFNEYIP